LFKVLQTNAVKVKTLIQMLMCLMITQLTFIKQEEDAVLKSFKKLILEPSYGNVKEFITNISGLLVSIFLLIIYLAYLIDPLMDAVNGTALEEYATALVAMIGVILGIIVIIPLVLTIKQLQEWF